MYFHPEIDSLFLREYTFDVGFHQSLALLRGSPDKDQIQRIMLSPNPLIDKFQIVDFPNLKSTEPRKWDAMDYEQISKFPLYFRIKWDGFNAKVGRTHFLSAIELICHGAMWTCNGQRFLGTVSREAVFLGISWKRPEEGEMTRVWSTILRVLFMIGFRRKIFGMAKLITREAGRRRWIEKTRTLFAELWWKG